MAGSANISWGYVGHQRGPRAAPIMYVATSQTFATTEASSTQSTANALDQSGHQLTVRIVVSEEGYVKIGANPTATTSSTRLVANVPEFFAVAPGDKVAIIDSA